MTDEKAPTVKAEGAAGVVRLEMTAEEALTFLDVAAALAPGPLLRFLPDTFRAVLHRMSDAAWAAQQTTDNEAPVRGAWGH